MNELHEKARAELALRDRLGGTDVRNGMLRELLAENERLNKHCEYWRDVATEMAKRAEAAEALLSDLPETPK